MLPGHQVDFLDVVPLLAPELCARPPSRAYLCLRLDFPCAQWHLLLHRPRLEAHAFLELNFQFPLRAPHHPNHLLLLVFVVILEVLVLHELNARLPAGASFLFSLNLLDATYQPLLHQPLLVFVASLEDLAVLDLLVRLFGALNHPLLPVLVVIPDLLLVLELHASLPSSGYLCCSPNFLGVNRLLLLLLPRLEAYALELNPPCPLNHPNHPLMLVFVATHGVLACLELGAQLLSCAYHRFLLSLFD